MKIPVFVSRPSVLTDWQSVFSEAVMHELDRGGLEARTVGVSDYPLETPLAEVYQLARHCSGGLILGFEQVRITEGVSKPGTRVEAPIAGAQLPTPWNQIEAGILFAIGVPLLVVKQDLVTGGIFDVGSSDRFIHSVSSSSDPRDASEALAPLIARWRSHVEEHYRH